MPGPAPATTPARSTPIWPPPRASPRTGSSPGPSPRASGSWSWTRTTPGCSASSRTSTRSGRRADRRSGPCSARASRPATSRSRSVPSRRSPPRPRRSSSRTRLHPARRLPPRRRPPELMELLVTEYVLEPDPRRADAGGRPPHRGRSPQRDTAAARTRRRFLPAPPAAASSAGSGAWPAPPSPTPAPAPVPRFVELSLEDAGGLDGVDLPRVAAPVAAGEPGSDPGYIDLELEEDPPAPARRSRSTRAR